MDLTVDPQGAAGAAPAPDGVGAEGLVADVRDGMSDRVFLEAVASAVAVRRRAEVDEVELAVGWAVRHGHPRDDRDPMVTPGGDGTPVVREYALPELAMVRGEHTLRTRNLVADGLDLHHRLPLTWAKVKAGRGEVWVARRVASMSRALAADVVGVVDRAVAQVVGRHAPSTVLEVAAAKVIEADPEAHAMRREEERRRRYVTLSKADEFGYRHVIAKVTAGDAAWVDAMVDRVADILALDHGHDHNRDQLRSLAFGWLARPLDLLKLLVDHTGQASRHDEPAEPAEPGESRRPVWLPAHAEATIGRLASMSTRQLAALRGRGVVFVHLSDRSLLAQAGVARVEGQGPFLVQALAELLGHADVALKPVIDHRVRHRADAYEHPEGLKDRVWTMTGGDVFPFSPRTATRDGVDFDHATPYRPPEAGGPPGQTGDHNSGPLRRRHHRWKTFGGYRCRQAGPGRHLWQTPYGICYLRDGEGTRRLTEDEAELILTAPPGLDVYPGTPFDLAGDYRA
jgi:hypothetical protein